MSSIVPPLDYIPKLPSKAVTKVIEVINKQTDKLADKVSIVVQESIKLPENCNCSDPQVQKVKEQLARVQRDLTKLQEQLPKIQESIDSVKTIVDISKQIKTAISIAQLANPVTAPLFIAQQLTAIQDATIVNAVESLNMFKTIPTTIASKINVIIPPLQDSLSKISMICNGDIDNISIPSSLQQTSDSGVDYNELLETEFYTDVNVSQTDLTDRSNEIENLVKQQRDLLTSLLEAPSVVYKQNGPPVSSLGKTGDYYIDISTQTVYGPKPSQNSWT